MDNETENKVNDYNEAVGGCGRVVASENSSRFNNSFQPFLFSAQC